ncbi:MAG: glycosyltransferase family 25 protein [Pseudomonadota bacterium]
MSAEILVINLDRADARLRFQETQMARLGLAFTRIKAIDGSDISDDFFERMRATGTRLVLRNEMACMLSHALCWRRSAEGGVPVIVLEDDTVLDPNFKSIVEAVSGAIDDPNTIVNFEYRRVQKTLGRKITDVAGPSFALHRLVSSGGGAAAYYVGPQAARALLAIAERRIIIADSLIDFPLRIKRFQVTPAPAAALDSLDREVNFNVGAFQSTIRPRIGRRRPPSMQSFRANPLTRLIRLQGNSHRWLRTLAHLGELDRTSFSLSPALKNYIKEGVPGL